MTKPAPVWPSTSLNAPQATRGTKTRLLPWPRRGVRILQLLATYGIVLCGFQEVGLRTAAAFANARAWLFLLATPNTRKGRSWQVGNGITAALRALQRLHKRETRIGRPGKRGALHIPIHLYRDRDTSDRIIFLAGHADRKRPNPTANRVVLTKLARLGRWLHQATGCPVQVVLDGNNDAGADAIFAAAGGTHLFGDHIDKGYGWGLTATNQRTLPRFKGVVTDHANPPAADVSPIEWARNFELAKLPRIPKTLRKYLRSRTA